MSLACDIKEIKELLEGLDTEIIATLCEKIEGLEAQNLLLEEKICGPCPVPLAEEMTNENQVVLEGDATDQFPEGSEMELTDDNGNVVGTAQVNSSTYNAETNTTTVALAQTQVTGSLAQIKSVKKPFVSQARVAKKEAVKENAVKEAVARG